MVILSLLITLLITHTQADKVKDVLEVFDLDWDDVVVEKGENWIEKYYIKQLKKCDLRLPDGYTTSLHSLAKNAPPDYMFTDKRGYTYFFNVCRNAIMTCNGRDDTIAI